MRDVCEERLLCKDASPDFVPVFFSSCLLLVEYDLDQLRQQEGEGQPMIAVE